MESYGSKGSPESTRIQASQFGSQLVIIIVKHGRSGQPRADDDLHGSERLVCPVRLRSRSERPRTIKELHVRPQLKPPTPIFTMVAITLPENYG